MGLHFSQKWTYSVALDHLLHLQATSAAAVSELGQFIDPNLIRGAKDTTLSRAGAFM